jgi:hypothetical protein
MKKLYVLLLAIAFGLAIQAQSLVISLDTNHVCKGQSVTATVKGPGLELETPLTGASSSQNGIMFDVTAKHGAIIKGFKTKVYASGSKFKVYYRPGSLAGYENSANG